jgi:hypothetical protein
MYKQQLTVREAIELLKKVENKDLPLAVWINSQIPEPVYSGGDRIPVVHIDTTVEGVIDICCEAPAIKPTME